MGRKKKLGKSAKKARASQVGNVEEEFKKAPHSFVFHRGHVGKNIKHLITDMRRVMEPYTASNLQARKKNVLKDFVNVAGLLNVSHFLMFSKTEIASNFRVVRLPRGPTLTFKIHNYCLAKDVISSLKKPNLEQKQFQHHPLLVMNNFSGEDQHLKLMATMFQNMFPSINVNKVKLNQIRRCVMVNYDPVTKLIDFRHYNIRVVPVGMSKSVKKLIKADVPDMSKYNDISEYMTKAGYMSDSEVELDGDHNEVVLPQHVGSRGNIKATKSAIRLTELGPRLTLQLVKIEEGICDGNVMFHEYIEKSEEELQQLKAMREKKRKIKEIRKRKQEENVQRKAKEKEDNKQRSLEGIKRKQSEENKEEESDSEDDREYYKQEVGLEPDKELFPSNQGKKRKKSLAHLNDNNKKIRKNSEKTNESQVEKMKFQKGKGKTGSFKAGKGKTGSFKAGKGKSSFNNKVQNKQDKTMKNKGSLPGRERKKFSGKNKNKR